MPILITGGTGAVGPQLVRQILAQGHEVRVLSRQKLPASMPPLTHLTHIAADICDSAALINAMRGADAVYHLAATIHNPNPTKSDAYIRVNVEGTRAVVGAAVTAGVRRVVFFSSISVYGNSQAQADWLTEDAPLHPDTWYGETKAHAEQIVLAEHRIERVVLRVATVYGPRIKGNYASLVKAIKRGVFVPIGPGTNRRTLVAVEDVARGAILAATHPQANGQIYNLTDGTVHTFNDIVNAIYTALGKRSPISGWHVPLGTIKLAAWATELVFGAAGKRSPIHRGRVEKLVEDMAVSGAKIQYELGFCPQVTNLVEGWRKALIYENP
jgi:UDP-glucose 4-epimerase